MQRDSIKVDPLERSHYNNVSNRQYDILDIPEDSFEVCGPKL